MKFIEKIITILKEVKHRYLWLILLLQLIPLTIVIERVWQSFSGYVIWRLQSGHFEGDEPSYLMYQFTSLQTMLDNYRTFGLPLFIHIYKLFFSNFSFWPHFQYVIYIASVLFLFWVLLKFGLDKFFSLFLVNFLLWNISVYYFLMWIYTEIISLSFLNITIALMLLAIKFNKGILLLIFSLSLFFLYQIRPNLTYTALLVPFWAMAFAVILYGFTISYLKKVFIRFLAASFIPLILFGLLRFIVLGQFGFSTMVGANLSGRAIYYLDENNINKIQPENRMLANDVLRWKRQISFYSYPEHELYPCSTSPQKVNTTSFMKTVEAEALCTHPDDIIVMNTAIKRQTGKEPSYDPEMNSQPWNYPLTLADFHAQNYRISMDKELLALANDILRIEWKRFINWMLTSAIYGMILYFRDIFKVPWMNFFYMLCILFSVFVHFLGRKGFFDKTKFSVWQKQLSVFTLMVITNFAAGYILLLITVYPYSRMFITLTPFMFPVFVLWAIPPVWLKRKNES